MITYKVKLPKVPCNASTYIQLPSLDCNCCVYPTANPTKTFRNQEIQCKECNDYDDEYYPKKTYKDYDGGYGKDYDYKKDKYEPEYKSGGYEAPYGGNGDSYGYEPYGGQEYGYGQQGNGARGGYDYEPYP